MTPPNRTPDSADKRNALKLAAHATEKAAIAEAIEAEGAAPRRLHIGGEERRDGWEIVNVQAGDHVDHLGDVLEVARRFDDQMQV